MSTSRGFTDLGALSGSETQFFFFEADVSQSDADDARQPAVGKLNIP